MNSPHQYILNTEINSLLEKQLSHLIQDVLEHKNTIIDKKVACEIAEEISNELEHKLTPLLQDLINKQVKTLTSRRVGW